jgi:hypothetical protein
MGEFHQHPDGMVFVRTDSGTYMDTVENFQLDSGRALELLPEGANDRVYTQGKRHAFMNVYDGNIIAGGPMPWPDGDNYIGRIEELLANQTARLQRVSDITRTHLDMGSSIMSTILSGPSTPVPGR